MNEAMLIAVGMLYLVPGAILLLWAWLSGIRLCRKDKPVLKSKSKAGADLPKLSWSMKATYTAWIMCDPAMRLEITCSKKDETDSDDWAYNASITAADGRSKHPFMTSLDAPFTMCGSLKEAKETVTQRAVELLNRQHGKR